MKIGGTSAAVISIALTVGLSPLNSSVSFSSHAHASTIFSRSFSLTSPPPEICGVRTLTVNVRVSNSPNAVSTLSSILLAPGGQLRQQNCRCRRRTPRGPPNYQAPFQGRALERAEESQARAGAHASPTGSQHPGGLAGVADAPAHSQDDAESRDLPGARGAVEKAISDQPPFGVLVPEMGRGLSQFSAVTSGDSLQGLPRVGIFGQTFRRPMEIGVTRQAETGAVWA